MSGEKTSFEEANGCAAGVSGRLGCWNADSEARLCNAMMQVGKWVEKEAGAMLGHIKCAVTLDDGSGATYNLTDMSNGVEKHGNVEPTDKVNFTFMSAVLDVEEKELQHIMYHAVDDSGLFYEIDEHVECHCHDHDHHHHHDGEECCCGHDHDHEHDHHHHHDDDDEHECCGGEHKHEHHHEHKEKGCCCHDDEEDGHDCCCDHDHEHDHHHHHDDDGHDCCSDHKEEQHEKKGCCCHHHDE